MTLDAALNGTLSDVQTDVQNVPIDGVMIHKLLILLCLNETGAVCAYNHFSAHHFNVGLN